MKTTRIILLTAVLAISLVLVLEARLNRAIEDEAVTYFSQRQLLLAEQTAAGIQCIFNEAQRDLMYLTGCPLPARLADALRAGDEEWITVWREACEQGFVGYLRSHPFYAQIRYIDTGGQELVGVDRDGERVRVIPQDQLLSQAERAFFVAARQLKEGEVYVSLLEPALGHGEVGASALTLRLITPVFDDQGRRAGIIVLNLLGEEIRAYVSRLSTEEDMDIWVLEETGVELINVTHPELEGRNAYEYLRQTGDETLVALTEELLAGGRGTAIYLWPESVGGTPAMKRLVAYVPLYPAEGQMWSVGVSVPYETILATQRQTRDTLLVLGGGMVAAILAGVFLSIRAERQRVEIEEQARFSELLHRWNMQLQTATLVSRVTSSILDVDRLIQQSVELIRERFGLYYAGLFLVNETGEWAVLRSGTGEAGRRMVEQGHKLEVGGSSMIGWCVAHQQARIALDVGAEATRFANPLLPETRSEIALPLISQGKAIGALTIQSTAAAAFSTEDIATLQTMADQLVNALEGARLHEQAQREIAERQRAEQALRESEEHFRALFETMVEGVALHKILYDESGAPVDYLIVSVNPAYKTHTGIDPEEAIGKRASELYGTSKPPYFDVYERVVRTGEPTKFEAYFEPLDKHFSISVVSPGKGQLATVFEDITERVQVEEEIKRYIRQLAALHAADLAIAANLDLHTVLTQVLNEAQALLSAEAASVLLPDSTGNKLIFTAVVGIGSEALKGTHILADASIAGWVMREAQPVLSTDVQTDPRFYANIDAITGLTTRSLLAVPLLRQGKTLGVIEVINRKNEEFNEHDLDLLNTLAGSAVIAIENARLYEETARRLAETRVLQEIMLASASTLDFDQVLTSTLRAIHRTLHIEHLDFILPDESGERMVVHPSFIGFIPSPEGSLHLPLDGSVAGRVYTTGQPELLDDVDKVSYYFKDPEGKTHSELAVPVKVNDRVVAVLNAESPHRGAFGEDDLRLFQAVAAQLGVVMENARLYEAEREQRKLVEQSRSQLVQSEKLAATGRLAASLAHEINNPLQAIHNSLQLLLSFSLDADEQREYLQMADEEVARLIGMVSRILDFARRPQQELRPTNVNDVIEKVLNLAGKYLQHRRIVLRRDLSPDLPVALAVPGELGQVFLNLVLNAVDAMPDGGTLHVASRLTADGHLTMTFSDTGHGISPEHLTRVFEPFFSTKEQGTGLGLFVSHNIVQRHGGEITVQSKVGAGATFTVRLPAARDVNGVSE